MSRALPAARVFAILSIGQVIVSVDAGVVPLAIPRIQTENPIGMTQMWWLLMAYLIAAACSAMVMGEIGDRLGRRRVYAFGQLTFIVGCVAAMASQSLNMAVAARAVQGVGAGAVTALALAMLAQSVDTEAIPRLEGWWMSISAASAAVGPIIGGLLVWKLNWRWVFGVEGVAMAIGLVLVLAIIDRNFGRGTQSGRVDVVGTVLLTIALIFVVAGLSMLDDHAFAEPQVAGPMLVGALVFVMLIVQQRRTRTPLTDWSMIRRRPVPGALGLLAVKVLVMTGALLQFMIVMQNVFGFTPFQAALTSFAMSAAVVAFSPLSGRLVHVIGLRTTIVIGLLLVAAAFLALGLLGNSSAVGIVVLWMALMGLGLGFADPALNASALAAVPKPALGAFSGFLGLILSMAGALGVAVVGTVAGSVAMTEWAAAELPNGEAWADRVLAGQLDAVAAGAGEEAFLAASAAFSRGVTVSLLVTSGVIALCAILAIPLLAQARDKASTTVPS